MPWLVKLSGDQMDLDHPCCGCLWHGLKRRRKGLHSGTFDSPSRALWPIAPALGKRPSTSEPIREVAGPPNHQVTSTQGPFL